MSRPTAAPRGFPYADHRAVAEVEADAAMDRAKSRILAAVIRPAKAAA